MKNELLSIGPFTIYGYGLMEGIGIIAAYLMTEYRARKKGLDAEPVFWLTVFSVAGGFLGSKCLYILTRLNDIISDPSIIKEVASGWVVYGGIIGGILAAVIFCKVKKLEFLRYMDVAMPAVALAQGFGRIGCFLAGCCYGCPTDGWLAVTFVNADFAPNGIPLVPTQLISSALNFLHFGVLVFLSNKLKAPGQIGALYLIFYSIGRFILEYFRGDLIRGNVGTFSTSQFISIFTVLAGILLIWGAEMLYRKKRNGAEHEGEEGQTDKL